MDIAAATGLELSSPAQARAYYEAHAPEDAPPFTEEVLPYLRYLTSYASWEQLLAAQAQLEDTVNRSQDRYRASYGEDAFDGPVEQEKFDALCALHEVRLDRITSTQVRDVMMRMVALLPQLRVAPINHRDDTADFVWSRLRCFFSGVGYKWWPQLVVTLQNAFPNCPFTTTESYEQFIANLDEAHNNCGWPCQLAWLPYHEVKYATETQPQGAFPPSWQRLCALLHILKHCRFRQLDKDEVVEVFYRSRYGTTSIKGKVTETFNPKSSAASISKALGCRPSTAKDKIVNVATEAVFLALQNLNGMDLLVRTSFAHLSPRFLVGPWSRLAPAVLSAGEFIQHGLTVLNVLEARDGRISPYTTTSDEVMNYRWEYGLPDPEVTHQWQQFRLTVPDTYTPAFPSDIFTRYFPNFDDLHVSDKHALRAVFDAPIIASLIRAHVPRLRQEYPFIVFLPTRPTLDDSTSQGKTLAASAYLKALCPSAIMVSAPETGSAPDNRTIAQPIRDHGTIGLDEWKVVAAKQSLLASDNLQSLCTGMTVAVGRALENSEGIHLDHSMVASSKVTEFKPDLYNRTFPMFLENLPPNLNINNVDYIASGMLSLEMRLGAVGLIEAHDFVGELIVGNGRGHRFTKHARIVELLYELRTDTPNADLSPFYHELTTAHQNHTERAQDSGLADVVRDDRTRTLSLNMLFREMTSLDVERLASACSIHGQTYSLVTLLNELGQLYGWSLGQLYFHITGDRPPSRRTIMSVVERDASRFLGTPGSVWALPELLGLEGWVIERADDPNFLITIRNGLYPTPGE